MDDFITKIYAYILEQNLIRKQDRILVACSGGPDSMALLEVMVKLSFQMGFDIGAAHLDHKIRKESARDLNFVRNSTKVLGIPFFLKSVDVRKYAKRKKITLEEAARKLRYEFLEKTAEDNEYNKIAVGHNSDDNIETVMFNLIRGTGISGLKGIPPKRGLVIRPMLSISRKEILKWLNFNKVEYVIDRTNMDINYTRNRIRLRLLPYIRKNFNPDFNGSVIRLSNISTEVDNFISTEACKAIKRLTIQKDKSKIVLDLAKFLKYDIGLRKIIVRVILKDVVGFSYPPDYKTINGFLKFCEANKTGKTIFPGSVIAELAGNRIIFGKTKKASINRMIRISGKITDNKLGFSIKSQIMTSVPREAEYIVENRNVAYFDLDKLGSRFRLRNVMNGDKMKPLGMIGHKNVMDILAENGIPSFLKDSYMVFTAKDRIAWIVGIRTSEDFKIDSRTRRTLRLEYAEQDIN